ncbi:FHA domain-containing protein [Geodermatophilaceae bacterium NBWT11]|nr:FHA domain-containing protein [Geodermatophilaceae bacterium NBWT11]
MVRAPPGRSRTLGRTTTRRARPSTGRGAVHRCPSAPPRDPVPGDSAPVSPTPADPAPVPPDRPAHRSWTLHGAGGVQVDVEVRAPGTATVAEVLHALPAAVPAGVPGTGADGLWSGSDRLDPATPLTDPALHHGARLGLGRPGPRPAAGGSAVELHVVGGPDAGRTLPLGREPVTVGRSRSCGLALADPDVSRAHVRVSAGTTAVLVGDLGSANGTALAAGSTTVDGDTPWPLGRPAADRLQHAVPECRDRLSRRPPARAGWTLGGAPGRPGATPAPR